MSEYSEKMRDAGFEDSETFLAYLESKANEDMAIEEGEKCFIEYWDNTPDEQRADRGFVLNAVKMCGEFIKYAAEHLKRDPEIVFEAVVDDIKAALFVPADLIMDTTIVSDALMWRRNSDSVRHCKWENMEEIAKRAKYKDEIVVGLAVNSSIGLFYLENILRNNVELAKQVLKHKPDAYNHLPAELRTDPEICTAAVLHDPFAYTYIDLSKHDSKTRVALTLMAFTARWEAPLYYSDLIVRDLWNYPEVRRVLAKSDPVNYVDDLPEEFIGNRDAIMLAVEHKAPNLFERKLSDEIYKDISLMQEAIIGGIPAAYEYAPEILKEIPDLAYRAIVAWESSIRILPDSLKSNYNLFEKLVKHDPLLLRWADIRLRNDDRLRSLALNHAEDYENILGQIDSGPISEDEDVALPF